jgi:hypothetical protein
MMLRRENAELRRAHEILETASALFATESGPSYLPHPEVRHRFISPHPGGIPQLPRPPGREVGSRFARTIRDELLIGEIYRLNKATCRVNGVRKM